MSRRGPTLEDVAREAGVSRATVSRVVNGVRNVDPGIQDLVRHAIDRTGYAPNRAARSLVTRRAGTVALVVSGAGDAFAARVFADPFFGRVVSGALGYLRGRGIHPVLMFAESEQARDQAVDYLRQGGADGALVVSIQSADPLPELLTAAGVPTVLFTRPDRSEQVSYVDLDHYTGARLAAEHLLARGCRRIATIRAPLDISAARERLGGFRDTLARAGQHHPPVVEGTFTLDSGAVAMARLLAEHPGVDGVFAANDLMAQGACQVLREQGRRIPGDVAVIGFDDSGIAVTCRPPLTTVRQPVERMAATMARLLEEQVRGVRTEPTSMVFTPELIVRESA
ncbi:LacI family DNA-binding transcriptional regulator [Streptomyces fulvorobeus]|uniref:DNA-binding LacI/PurR family transcriptional regulator n=1 Tax=Streptomyces fulvorobeus TaxID=284028 RepID=A0A7J0C4G5_9ACTN|nr:LacI family DNA-binding transcriptional regulator [Streptomyces fulvorobeus]NYE41022.1 DNA-binding LacI/PurR family transcriptional regulator [Streptomyces fulvorobeus]GFM97349.1 LacI family transcriptional regulator [Streptomyces fulvorobeus]